MISFDTHSTPNLQTLAILKKNQVLFKDSSLFFQNQTPKVRTL